MNKKSLDEISSQLETYSDLNGKLDHLNSLLKEKTISKPEHDVLMRRLLNGSTEHTAYQRLNLSVFIAIVLLVGIFSLFRHPAVTGFTSFDTNVSAPVKDAHGNSIDARLIITDLDGTVVYDHKGRSHTQIPGSGRYKVRVEPDDISVKSIEFENAEFNVLNIVSIDHPTNKGRFAELYAIDPTAINFTTATVTINKAKGNKLYKCSAWDFQNQQCNGAWVLFKSDLVPGQSYTFELTPDDPGFGEIIEASSALHLDENRSIISDVYEQIRQKDDVWSEPIYENEFVRVTFSKNLTSSNDITIFARNNQSLNTKVEVYYSNSTEKITEFPVITTADYYKIFLNNMIGNHDAFDLKIVNNDPDQAFLEFDHIIDPAVGNITFDNNASKNGTSVSYLEFNLTVGTGPNRILFVGTGSGQNSAERSVVRITYNGTNLTKITSQDRNGFGNLVRAELWYLVAPVSGTYPVNVTWDASDNHFMAGAVSLNKVDQTSPLGKLAQAGGCNPGGPSVSISTEYNNSWIIDVFDSQDKVPFTVGAGQTERWHEYVSPAAVIEAGGSTRITGGNGTFTMSWTGGNPCWGAIAQEVRSTQTVPLVNNVILNSTLGTNFTNENLTVYWNSTDADNDSLVNITDWRVNNVSIELLNAPFEAGSNGTTTKDYSTNARTITVMNGTVFNASEGFDGKGGYQFDGINDYINATKVMYNNTVTYGAWFKLNSFSCPGNFCEIVIQEDGSTNGFELSVDTVAQKVLCYDGNGNPNEASIELNKWYFALCMHNGTTFDLYLNGTRIGTPAASVNRNPALVDMFIGGTPIFNNYYFNGSIDRVFVYNRSLSDDEINVLYNNRTDLIVHNETKAGENWSVALTPNDGVVDGATVLSNNLIINNLVNITAVYPNDTGQVQNITSETNISVVKNASATVNITFNITATSFDNETLTFTWYVNQVLRFTQNLISGATSLFSNLFNVHFGQYNVTAAVNGTGFNDSFTFNLNITNVLPVVNNVILNSTFGTNLTNENLTVYWNSTDDNNDVVYNNTDWRLNGNSIAVLNMPFEADGRQNATDYSTFGNNGTVLQAANITWTTSGKVGGAYIFNGNPTSRILATSTSFNFSQTNKFAVSIWFNWSGGNCSGGNGNGDCMLIYNQPGFSGDWRILSNSGVNSNPRTIIFSMSNGTGNPGITSTSNVFTTGVWHHLVGTWNSTFMRLYVDGVQVGNATYGGGIRHTSNTVIIGNGASNGVGVFNGTIDQVYLFNRSLSEQEILVLNNSRNDILVEPETLATDNWTACVIPNDGITDGNTVCSNGLFVRNIVNITSIYPNGTGQVQNITSETNISMIRNLSVTTNLTFNITATSFDNETLTFTWYVDQVLRYIQNLISGATSLFSNLFNTVGQHNISVTVNGTGFNTSFTFNVNFTNAAPAVNNVIINSTFVTNFTNENLTVYWNLTDVNGDSVTNITDWRLFGNSIAVLNMPFENFTNAANNVTDYSTFKNNGSAVGGVAWNSSGKYGGAYKFDGSNDYIRIDDSPSLNLSTNFSVFLWAKRDGSSSFERLIGKYKYNGLSTGSWELDAGDTNSSRCVFIMSNGEVAPSTAANTFSNDSSWHFLGCVYNGTRVIAYADGTKTVSSLLTARINTTIYPLTIGTTSNGTNIENPFKGMIDQVLIFNRSLSDAEITTLYNNRTDILVHQETVTKDNWTACVTPNDGQADGNTACSNNLIINNLVNITAVYPNDTGQVQNITSETNISIVKNASATTNLTFNITATSFDNETLTFTWYVNQVLKFTQNLISGATSLFSNLFNVHFGKYNVTAVVNGTGFNDSFTFNLNITNVLPVVNNVVLNSTFGTNLTNENLTVYWNSTDDNNDKLINITDWRLANISIALSNLPFENNSNSVNNFTDYSTNNITGGVRNGAVWVPNGYRGGAYSFDGVNDYLYVSNNTLNGSTAVTISLWINKSEDSTGPSAFERWIGSYQYYDANNQRGTFVMYDGGSNNTICEFFISGLDRSSASTTNSFKNDSKFHMITCVYNGTRILNYIDGILNTTSGAFIGNLSDNASYPITIGTTFNGTSTFQNLFKGQIDEALILNRSLSPSQIFALYNNRTDLMVEQETRIGDNWSACITPNDGQLDGNTVCSNGLFVRNIVNITSIYPNGTGQVQNITSETNITFVKNASATVNFTFNVTANASDSETLTFSWYVNQVLRYVQNLISGATSLFSNLFNIAGQYNVTAVVNGTGFNDSFTFNINFTNALPATNNVVLNSTFATNFTNENLTVYWNSTDANNDSITNLTDWLLNGVSIDLLNAPFDGGSNSTWTRDYSSNVNNLSVVNATWNATGGYNGHGAYVFNGIENRICMDGSGSCGGSNPLFISQKSNLTVTTWYNSQDTTGLQVLYDEGGTSNAINLYIRSGRIFGGVSVSAVETAINTTTTTGWHYVAFVYDAGGEGQLRLYVDGAMLSNTSYTTVIPASHTDGEALGGVQGNVRYDAGTVSQGSSSFNGSLDSFIVYSRALSPEEINLTYKNTSNIISDKETFKSQNWTVCITPNDGFTDGNTICSNNLTIANSAPTTPNLTAPNNGNNTLTDLNVTFSWENSTDADNDTIKYDLNITSQSCSDKFFANITNTSFISTNLNTVDQCGYYNWSVRAFDGTSYSGWSTKFNFSIVSVVNIFLVQNTSNFGYLAIKQTNDTADNNPPPFIVQSDSNIPVNITVKALNDLWNTSGLGNTTFRYKANLTNETGSFATTKSQTTYTPVTRAATFAIAFLNFTDINDTAGIDLEITVPNYEPPGNKSSTVVVGGLMS